MVSAIFYLLIFSIPLQARVVLGGWTQHLAPMAQGAGFNQWTSAYIYGTDLLLAALFLLWFWRIIKSGPKIFNFQFSIFSEFSIFKLPNFWLAVFFAISAVSVVNSKIVELSWYQLLKLAEFIGFYFYLRRNLGKIFSFRGVLSVIIVSGFVQAIIGIIQYLKQGSLGLYVLGESPLAAHAQGVAVFIADGARYIRAYGLTPHPNILAAWLFAALFAFYYWYLYRDKSNFPEKPDLSFYYDRNKKTATFFRKYGLIFVYPVVLFGFLFTFSRVLIGLWVLGILARLLIVLLKRNFRENKMLWRGIRQLTTVSVAFVAVFSLLFWPQVKSRLIISPTEEAVTQRVFYNREATKIAEGSPWLGVGIGQFVPEMMSRLRKLPSYAYQPVHNIYLLIASETGFVGMGAFLALLFSIFWRFIRAADFKKLYNFSFLIFAFSFLLMGLFDHFLWTSQQGGFIFWMALALLSIRA